MALLVEYFNELPELRVGDDPRKAATRVHAAVDKFRRKVSSRYTEGTLQRLLDAPSTRARRAAALALGLVGTMASNQVIAKKLKDDDKRVRQLAVDALWSLWFRADTEVNNKELQRLVRVKDQAQALEGLSTLIKRAPGFAEAYNQRAIVYFRMKEYYKSIADCERVVQLNPQHFGAWGGMAQSLMNLHRPNAALKAFRGALRINPTLDGVAETIRSLEAALGEEGMRDDKK
jgi:tetratricopeptide (TPR) repeat protein